MRRILVSAIAVLALSAGAVFAGAPAHAVDAPPPHIDPVYDLPSTWQGGTLTEEEALLRKHEIDLARRADSLKWWSKPVSLTSWKGLGSAAGAAGFAASVGFGVGNDGVQLVASMFALADSQGQAPDWYCRNQQWYQSSTLAGQFNDLSGLCALTVRFDTPNSDVSGGGMTDVLFGAGGFAYMGGSSLYNIVTCYKRTGDFGWPAYGVGFVEGGVLQKIGADIFTGNMAQVGCGAGSDRFIQTSNPGIARLVIYRASDDAVMVASTEVSADPSRSTRCTYNFRNSPSKSSEWVNYKDSTGLPAAALGAACDAVGSTLTEDEILELESIGIEERTDGGAITERVNAPVPSEMTQVQDEFPECVKQRCGLSLLKTIPEVGELSCLVNGSTCANWWSETSQGTVPGSYRCLWGSYQVDLAECSVYRSSFLPGTTTPTITDPKTGEQIEWGGQTDPGNSTNPGTGPSPGGQCMASWGSAPDPLSWVFWPVRCALVWAFVPRQANVDAARVQTESKWRLSTPGKLAESLLAISPALAELDTGGCGGIILAVPKVGAGWGVTTENRAFLPACPGDFFAPWAPIFYWLILLSFVLGGLIGIKRQLDRFVGFG